MYFLIDSWRNLQILQDEIRAKNHWDWLMIKHFPKLIFRCIYFFLSLCKLCRVMRSKTRMRTQAWNASSKLTQRSESNMSIQNQVEHVWLSRIKHICLELSQAMVRRAWAKFEIGYIVSRMFESIPNFVVVEWVDHEQLVRQPRQTPAET